MKKAIIILACSALLWSCKKDKDVVSKVVKVSYPTVTFAGESITGYRTTSGSSTEDYYLETIGWDQSVFITFPVGATVNVTPTAYDSVLKQNVNVEILRNGNLNTNVPGLYIYDLRTGTNSNGYGTKVRYYIGITNADPDIDLSGDYAGSIGADPSNDAITIQALAPAMYFVDDPVTDLSQIGGVFVHTTDTTVDFGTNQPTDLGAQSYGEFEEQNGKVSLAVGDTVISYQLINPTINSTYPATTIFSLTKQ